MNKVRVDILKHDSSLADDAYYKTAKNEWYWLVTDGKRYAVAKIRGENSLLSLKSYSYPDYHFQKDLIDNNEVPGEDFYPKRQGCAVFWFDTLKEAEREMKQMKAVWDNM
jgi:hypothetical protein